MNKVNPTSWIAKQAHKQSYQPEQDLSHPHQLPPYSSSTAAAPSPSPSQQHHLTPKLSAVSASFRSVFHRQPHRERSHSSLNSAFSKGSASSSHHQQPNPNTGSNSGDRFSSNTLHPYAAMVAAPLPVVSSRDSTEDEEECPVCLEPLSFSFRLPGEKPHIVPECGHALHEVRFVFLTTFCFPASFYSSRRGLVATLICICFIALIIPSRCDRLLLGRSRELLAICFPTLIANASLSAPRPGYRLSLLEHRISPPLAYISITPFDQSSGKMGRQ